MEYRIALLLKEHYLSRFTDQLKTVFEDMDLQFFSYETLEELNRVFLSIRQNFDGFVVSGIIPLQSLFISGAADENTLIEICPIDIENTYRILLKQLVTPKDLKLSRIGMDFLQDEHTLEDLISRDQFAENVHAREDIWKTFTTLEELTEEEERISEAYRCQYEKKKIDVIITYFYSAVLSMKDCDIDCFYVYPSSEMFIRLIENLKKSISLKRLKETLSCVIHIDMEDLHKLDNASYERCQLEFNRIFMEFNQQYFNKLVVKINYNDIEIYTDYSVLKKLTENFSLCPLWLLLNRKLGFNRSIGYGIGTSLYQARINAVDACHYSSAVQNQERSFLIDEKGNLTVLSTEKTVSTFAASEKDVARIANDVRLSSETVVRLMGIVDSLKTDDVTSQELVNHLGVSLRSANKFLSSLERCGYACIVSQKRNGNKGRPVNVYRLSLK